MTQQDNWREEMAHLVQRQDQMERQQRETSTTVNAIKRDVDTLTGAVDRRIESLRRDVDWKFEWRVKSLESSRDSTFNIMMYTMMIGAVVALFITLAISIIDAREERQEMAPPEERPLSSMNAPHGDQVQLYLLPNPHLSVTPGAQGAPMKNGRACYPNPRRPPREVAYPG